MIETALFYKDVFNSAKLRDLLCKICPTEIDWEMTYLIIEKLQLFYETTEIFSSSKYPTPNIYFPKVCEIKLTLS